MNITELNELKVVKNEIPYSNVVDYIDFVVTNSYAKGNGRYHEYLTDYSEAVAILTMYTDVKDYDFKFNDVMAFIQTDKWSKIKEELGDTYINFHYYVKREIEYLNTPMRFADDTMKKMIEVMDNINTIVKAVDVDALKNYDFAKIVDTISEVEAAKDVKA